MSRILCVTDVLFETLAATILSLNNLKFIWKLQGASLKKRVLLVPHATSQVTRFNMKVFTLLARRIWHVPIAIQAQRTCVQLCRKHNRALRKGTLTEEQSKKAYIQIARASLGAVFDSVTIQHISTYAARMGLYQLDQGTPVFKLGLEPQDVINLMEQRVSAVCISYKHTRRSEEGFPKDVARVQTAVAEVASFLSQQRLLFWCDIIGHTPQGASWAQQGIDPYLCMPTLRIVSAKLQEEINDSFWMTIERLAAKLCSGMFWYDEDEARPKFLPRDDGYFSQVPTLWYPLEVAKFSLAKLICNPILYYRRARCENDKLEVIKYAVSSLTSGDANLGSLERNEEGLFKVSSTQDVEEAFNLFTINRSALAVLDGAYDMFEKELGRPQGETIIKDSERWRGVEELFPAFQLVESQCLEELNTKLRPGFFWIRRVSSAVDNVTDVICATMGNMTWGSALRLRVAGFEEHEDWVIGRVMSFRVATEKEELLMSQEPSIHKYVCFV